MTKSESIKELAIALAKAQGEIENAGKNAKNPHFGNKYADLAEILNTVRPVFSANGLSIVQLLSYGGPVYTSQTMGQAPTATSYNSNMVSVETILMHSSGEWISGTISVPVSKPDAQGVGSACTYARRYSLAGICGVAQEDDDGNHAVGGEGQSKGYARRETAENTRGAVPPKDPASIPGVRRGVPEKSPGEEKPSGGSTAATESRAPVQSKVDAAGPSKPTGPRDHARALLKAYAAKHASDTDKGGMNATTAVLFEITKQKQLKDVADADLQGLINTLEAKG